jgi:hypothetical protein
MKKGRAFVWYATQFHPPSNLQHINSIYCEMFRHRMYYGITQAWINQVHKVMTDNPLYMPTSQSNNSINKQKRNRRRRALKQNNKSGKKKNQNNNANDKNPKNKTNKENENDNDQSSDDSNHNNNNNNNNNNKQNQNDNDQTQDPNDTIDINEVLAQQARNQPPIHVKETVNQYFNLRISDSAEIFFYGLNLSDLKNIKNGPQKASQLPTKKNKSKAILHETLALLEIADDERDEYIKFVIKASLCSRGLLWYCAESLCPDELRVIRGSSSDLLNLKLKKIIDNIIEWHDNPPEETGIIYESVVKLCSFWTTTLGQSLLSNDITVLSMVGFCDWWLSRFHFPFRVLPTEPIYCDGITLAKDGNIKPKQIFKRCSTLVHTLLDLINMGGHPELIRKDLDSKPVPESMENRLKLLASKGQGGTMGLLEVMLSGMIDPCTQLWISVALNNKKLNTSINNYIKTKGDLLNDKIMNPCGTAKLQKSVDQAIIIRLSLGEAIGSYIGEKNTVLSTKPLAYDWDCTNVWAAVVVSPFIDSYDLMYLHNKGRIYDETHDNTFDEFYELFELSHSKKITSNTSEYYTFKTCHDILKNKILCFIKLEGELNNDGVRALEDENNKLSNDRNTTLTHWDTRMFIIYVLCFFVFFFFFTKIFHHG